MKILFAVVFFIVCNLANAETYLQINGASVHDRAGFNSVNYGAGVEQTIAKRWTVAGGWYRNSDYRGSFYSYARYSVYKEGPWNLGIGAGVVTGYHQANVLPMAFPEACYGYVCAIALPQVVPGGASVLGFHLKIPVN